MFKLKQCEVCDNLTKIIDRENAACLAFPNGIPKDLWDDKVEHTKPYPNDNGIQFSKEKSQIKYGNETTNL